MTTMFERFTDKARAAVFQARATAAGRGDQLRPAYLLYALAAGEGVAARVLASLGVEATGIERQLDRAAPLGNPLAGEADSADAEALAAIGVDLDEIRRKVEEGFGPGALGRMPAPPRRRPGRTTVTLEAKQSLALALAEARALHHDYIGPEHLLLGLLASAGRTSRGDFTLDTLRDFGIDPDQARQRVLDELRRATA
jgi:ATP-dependent Clp protease ATP-binding subunit ClpA